MRRKSNKGSQRFTGCCRHGSVVASESHMAAATLGHLARLLARSTSGTLTLRCRNLPLFQNVMGNFLEVVGNPELSPCGFATVHNSLDTRNSHAIKPPNIAVCGGISGESHLSAVCRMHINFLCLETCCRHPSHASKCLYPAELANSNCLRFASVWLGRHVFKNSSATFFQPFPLERSEFC